MLVLAVARRAVRKRLRPEESARPTVRRLASGITIDSSTRATFSGVGSESAMAVASTRRR
jgi:hypothetical protein